jgi:glucuronate isomerase
MTSPSFIHEDFLLQYGPARRLFHEYAEDLPIIDYHCHLPPEQVAHNRQFENLTQIWLNGDHYKWRAMRGNGVPERFCTGDASDWEKFLKWAETVPYTLRNPLYHWTHLELNRPFGINDRLLNQQTARSIWDECNAKLKQPEFSCRGIMQQMKVALVCTTDDPVSNLGHHQKIKTDSSFSIQVLPTWRPDKAMAPENPVAFNTYLDELSLASGVEIRDLSSLMDALQERHDFFARMGCRLSDHGVETIYADPYTDSEIAAIFAKVRSQRDLAPGEVRKFKSAMLFEFGRMDHEKGWTQQFHLGAMRNNNSRMFQSLGPDTGFDSIGDYEVGRPLSRFLDRLDQKNCLARSILYNLNPRDNELLATMIGNFQDGATPGKIQWGSSWWFLDQKDGMEKQLEALSNMGLLSRFVGMLTDSRSFLSYTRHEYFRRILCNLLGHDMVNGLIPADFSLVGKIVQDICYHNAASYFGFNLPRL